MNKCLFFYHHVDGGSMNCLETVIATLRRYAECEISIYADNKVACDGARTVLIPSTRGRRQLAKLRAVQDFLGKSADGDQLLISDIDIYFKADPFVVFDGTSWAVGLTGRFYQYHTPINGGIWFIRAGERARQLLAEPLERFIKSYSRGYDWYIDQDFLCKIRNRPGVVDIGWQWNYCPGDDVFGREKAEALLMAAVDNPNIKILHLKGFLKLCLPRLPGAITRHGTGRDGWI